MYNLLPVIFKYSTISWLACAWTEFKISTVWIWDSQCRLSDSSAPESCRVGSLSGGSPSTRGTCGPSKSSQRTIRSSTRLGTARELAGVGVSAHKRLGPTQTPKLAADMRLCGARRAIWCRTQRKWLRSVTLDRGSCSSTLKKRSIFLHFNSYRTKKLYILQEMSQVQNKSLVHFPANFLCFVRNSGHMVSSNMFIYEKENLLQLALYHSTFNFTDWFTEWLTGHQTWSHLMLLVNDTVLSQMPHATK
jgi:hypothetical protein